MLLVLLPLLAFLWAALLALRSSARHARLSKHFVSPPVFPVIGHVKDYWGDEEHVFQTTRNFYKAMGTRWFVKVMNEFAINLNDAEAVETVMTSSKHIEKGPLYDFLLQWLGRGLLTNFGPSWHHRRKLLTPAFHFKILDEFGPMISQYALRLVAELDSAARAAWGPVDVVLPVSKFTLGTICETAMGVDLHACGQEDEYFRAVRTVGRSVCYRLTRPWTWRDGLFNLTPYGRQMRRDMKTLHDFTMKVIRERKSSHSSSGVGAHTDTEPTTRKRRLGFLDVLLAAQREDPTLTDEDIRQEVDTFMFEGHETTAMGICWTLFLLGNHQEAQDRVREEVRSAGADWQAVVALPYLEMVIKESLRLYPPVMFIARQNAQGLQIGDKWVEPGVSLDMTIFLLHRDPTHFPDPERFDPERFSPEQERGRHPFAYVPFSGGLRNCIGRRFAMMELKLTVAALIRRFALRSEHSQDEIAYKPELVLRPKQGIQLHMTPL